MVHHRLLFRRGEKRYLVDTGNRCAIVAMGFLAVGLTGILVVISNFVFGGPTPIVVGVLAALAIGYVWFALPLKQRRREAQSGRRHESRHRGGLGAGPSTGPT
jgi:uncharacterized membrane protein YccC